MNREEFENAVMLFERKKLRESKITQVFMDLYVANKGTEGDLEEYAGLADNEEYLKDIEFTVKGITKTRKARDIKKIREWFYAKYSPNYKYEEYETAGKPNITASMKLAMKLNGMKF